MFNKLETICFRTAVQTVTGAKDYTMEDKILDINEFHKALNDKTKEVILINDVSKWTGTDSYELYYHVTAKVKPVEGFDDCYVFTCYSRSGTGSVINRKIAMSFKGSGEDAILHAVAYAS